MLRWLPHGNNKHISAQVASASKHCCNNAAYRRVDKSISLSNRIFQGFKFFFEANQNFIVGQMHFFVIRDLHHLTKKILAITVAQKHAL